MSKAINLPMSERERFSLWVHFNSKMWACNDAREQDQIDDLWSTFDLDRIKDTVDSANREMTDKDFDATPVGSYELTKEEIGYLVKFCGKPMIPGLSRLIRPIRVRWEEARDKAGLKAVAAE